METEKHTLPWYYHLIPSLYYHSMFLLWETQVYLVFHPFIFSRYSLCGTIIIIMVEMKSYCEAGVSMQQVWVEGGLTLCFYFTLVPSVLLTFSFLFGTFLCICYGRYGTDMEPKFIPRSRLYRLQVGLSVLLVLLALGWMVFRIARSGELPGYVVLYGCLSMLGWLWAVALLRLERKRVLVRDRTRGHSTVLLLYWAVAFAAENLAFVSWVSPQWWWTLETFDQQVRVRLVRKNAVY